MVEANGCKRGGEGAILNWQLKIANSKYYQSAGEDTPGFPALALCLMANKFLIGGRKVRTKVAQQTYCETARFCAGFGSKVITEL